MEHWGKCAHSCCVHMHRTCLLLMHKRVAWLRVWLHLDLDNKPWSHTHNNLFFINRTWMFLELSLEMEGAGNMFCNLQCWKSDIQWLFTVEGLHLDYCWEQRREFKILQVLSNWNVTSGHVYLLHIWELSLFLVALLRVHQQVENPPCRQCFCSPHGSMDEGSSAGGVRPSTGTLPMKNKCNLIWGSTSHLVRHALSL